MATKILTNLDLQQNQLIKARLDNQSSDPSGSAGQVYYNTGSQIIKYYDGTTWQTLSAATSSVANVSATSPIQVNGGAGPAVGAITVSILAASGITPGSMSTAHYSLVNGATASNNPSTLVLRDGSGNFAAGVITATGVTITGTVTNATDAATKAYVDSVATGLDIKASVRAATTVNLGSITYTATGGTSGRGQITTAPNTIDGVTLAATNRILIKDQTTGAQNGIYVVTTLGTGANGVWDRATDFDQDAEVTSGAFTFVEEGTVNDNSGWVLATNNPITIGGASGTSLAFSQFSGAGQITAGAGLTKTGNTIDAIGTTNRIDVFTDNIDIAATYVGQTSITTLGTVTSGTWSATTIATTKGGTGLTAYTTGDTLYSSATNTLSALAGNATATKKFMSMTSSVPSWGVLVNTDIPAFTGSTGSVAGTLGGVPAPGTTDNVKYLRGDSTWQTVTAGTVTSVSIGATNGGTSLLQVTNGTTAAVIDFVTTPTGNTVLASPSGGGSGAPLFRSLVVADLPTVTVAKGGTGLTAAVLNGVLYGASTSTTAFTAIGSQFNVLVAGSGGLPAFGTLNLASAAAVGSSILGLANGGTNSSTASGARTQLASDVTGGTLPVKVSFNVGDGSSTAITVTHNLGTRDIVWDLVTNATPWDSVIADITFPTTNTTTATFNVAPTTNAYRLVLIG
jgi:hypothetical protein